jgi:hypothetical protein
LIKPNFVTGDDDIALRPDKRLCRSSPRGKTPVGASADSGVIEEIGGNLSGSTYFTPLMLTCVYRKLKHARSDGEARRGSYMT